MGLFNSSVIEVQNGWVSIDIGQQWAISLEQWLQIPGSSQPYPGQYWTIAVSSVANLLAGEMPCQVQRTNDALDGMDDYFAASYERY